MAHIKFAVDQLLEKLELDRFRDFSDILGFRRFVVEESQTFGLLDKPKNGLVEIDANNSSNQRCIKINELKAVDSNGNLIHLTQTNSLPITINNIWFWIKVSHIYSNFEEGIFNIDANGYLTGVDANLTDIIRVLPNFPTKVSFEKKDGSGTLNNLEYEVLELIDDNTAKLNGNSFYVESGLRMKIVGTFTPGISIPLSSKYPFNFDSCKYEFVIEEIQNTPPAKIDGIEFYLCRVKLIEGEIVVQDKRTEYWSKVKPIQNDFFNLLTGVESIKWNTEKQSVLQLAWNIRSENYSIDTSRNLIALHGTSSGGKYKSVNDMIGNEFIGWRLYTVNGQYTTVLSSSKQGDSLNLFLEKLETNNFSVDGGMTFEKSELLLTPPFDSIQIMFTNSLGENIIRESTINVPYINQQLPLVERKSTSYIIKTRYSIRGLYSKWEVIPSDNNGGYINENNVKTTYISQKTEGFIKIIESPDSYLNLKDNVQKTFDGIEELQFESGNLKHITFKKNKKYQILGPNSFSNADGPKLFLNIKNEDLVNGASFVFLVSPECNLGGRLLYIVHNYQNDTNTGTVLKFLTLRDIKFASLQQTALSFEIVTDGFTFYIAQNYDLGFFGEFKEISGSLRDGFDSTGLGTSEYLGWALANGQNLTQNRFSEFILKDNSQDDYKRLIIQKLY